MPETADTLAASAQSAWGSDARAARIDDAVDGITPAVVLQPSSIPMLADMLRWANRGRLVLLPRGCGTKISWGPRLRSLDGILSLTELPGRIEHAAGDLVAILPAGASLSSVNDTLGHERQWLPLDPFSRGASIGGIVATNESGPRRLKHGAPRDLIIGVEMVLADGTFAKSGGRVVKNVSGYDLARMLCGSFGTLAVITSATFKLAPRPGSSCTIVSHVESAPDIGRLTLALGDLPLVPSAIDFDGPPWRLLVRVESTEAATEQHTAELLGLFTKHDVSCESISGLDEDTLWRGYGEAIRSPGGTLLNVSVPPSSLSGVLDTCTQLAQAQRLSLHTSGRATLGVFNLRMTSSRGEDDAADVASAIAALRERAGREGGFAVLLEASLAVKDRVAAWGAPWAGGRLMQAVKQSFDPHGTLNPDRSFA